MTILYVAIDAPSGTRPYKMPAHSIVKSISLEIKFPSGEADFIRVGTLSKPASYLARGDYDCNSSYLQSFHIMKTPPEGWIAVEWVALSLKADLFIEIDELVTTFPRVV